MFEFPGQVGSRNILRGNCYASLDMSLVKTWKMPYNEAQIIQFRWEVLNTEADAIQRSRRGIIFAHVAGAAANSFGAYTSLLTQP